MPKLILVPPIETINEEGKEPKKQKNHRGKSIRFKEDKDLNNFLSCNEVISKEYMKMCNKNQDKKRKVTQDLDKD